MKNRDYTYTVVIEQYDKEKCYVVKYADLSIIGVGSTSIEALNEAEANKNAYLDYLDEIGEAYPPISVSGIEYSGRITLRISKSLHQRANDRAKEEGVSLNSLVAEALNKYVSKNETYQEITSSVAKYVSAIYVPNVATNLFAFEPPLYKSRKFSSNNEYQPT